MAIKNRSNSLFSALSLNNLRPLKAATLLLIASATLAATACAPDTTDDVDTPAEQQELDQGTMENEGMPEEGMTEEGVTEEGAGTSETGE